MALEVYIIVKDGEQSAKFLVERDNHTSTNFRRYSLSLPEGKDRKDQPVFATIHVNKGLRLSDTGSKLPTPKPSK